MKEVLPKYYTNICYIMSAASRVFEAATEGGYSITPEALVAAIRTALIECRDKAGYIDLSKVYELTCELENLNPSCKQRHASSVLKSFGPICQIIEVGINVRFG